MYIHITIDHNLITQLHKDMTASGSSTLYQVHLTSQLTQPEVKHPQNWPAKGKQKTMLLVVSADKKS
jgi:hypothetical protein